MARQTAISINSIPIGPLGIIGMPGCEELTDKIDKYLVKWRKTQAQEHAETIAFYGWGDEFICSLNLLPLGARLAVNQFGAFGPGLMQVPMEHA